MTNIEQAQMINIIPKMDSRILRVHQNRCKLVRNRNSKCLRCAAVCTTGAISETPAGIEVDPARCIGCGTCASVCPTCALEALNPPDAQLAQAAADAVADGGRVTFVCNTALQALGVKLQDETDAGRTFELEIAGQTVAAVNVVCAGRVDESIIVEAAARGASQVAFVCGACATCVHKTGGTLAAEMQAQARALLEAFGQACAVEVVDVMDASLVEGARQTLEQPASCAQAASDTFDNLGGNVGSDCSTFEHVQKDGTLSHFVPEKRLRLYNCMKRFGGGFGQIEQRLWGQISINTDLCRTCRMCAVFCPTGAISKAEFDGGCGIEQRPTLCVQCKMCEEICTEQAISISNVVDIDTLVMGRKVAVQMQPTEFEPSSDTQMAQRMARFMKVDTFQDPQAKMKPRELAEMRNYSKSRAQRRAEIRSNQ